MEPIGKVWSDVPSEILIHVISLLEDEDRAQVSQVCKSWHQVYQHPSLWRSASFTFRHSERPLPERLQNVKIFLKLRGVFIHNICIRYPREDIFEPRSFAQCLHTFLSGLSELPQGLSTVRSFKLVDFRADEKVNSETPKYLMGYAISEFLLRQKCLATVDLSNSFDDITISDPILDSLVKSQCVKTLISLTVTYKQYGNTLRRYLPILLPKCSRLQELKLDYSNLWVLQLHTVIEALTHTLTHLAVTVRYFPSADNDRECLDPEDWAMIGRNYPHLKISFRVCLLNISWQKLLLPSIHLVELVYEITPVRSMDPDIMKNRINNLLTRLAVCTYRGLRSISIGAFSLEFKVVLPLKEALIDCLVKCPNIHELNFSSQLMTYKLKYQVRSELLQIYQLDKDVINIV